MEWQSKRVRCSCNLIFCFTVMKFWHLWSETFVSLRDMGIPTTGWLIHLYTIRWQGFADFQGVSRYTPIRKSAWWYNINFQIQLRNLQTFQPSEITGNIVHWKRKATVYLKPSWSLGLPNFVIIGLTKRNESTFDSAKFARRSVL